VRGVGVVEVIGKEGGGKMVVRFPLKREKNWQKKKGRGTRFKKNKPKGQGVQNGVGGRGRVVLGTKREGRVGVRPSV